MPASDWFDIPVLGRLPPEQAEAKLRELGETDAAEAVRAAPVAKGFPPAAASWWPFTDRPWQHVAHAFGFVTGGKDGDGYALCDAGQMPPDGQLKGALVKITLDTLYAAGYPGFGEHQVLFDFYAEHQTPEGTEPLHFGATLRVRDGQPAGVRGQPLFVGLKVGSEGVNLRCLTINVANAEDERFLGFLDSNAFRGGLKLLTTLQPATALFSETAIALTKHLAQRHRNVAVQEFRLGLDFSGQTARAALTEGSYVAIQVPGTPDQLFRWQDWLFLPGGQIVSKADPHRLPPFNYVLLTVTRYQAPDSAGPAAVHSAVAG
jgi:hypothetical protein